MEGIEGLTEAEIMSLVYDYIGVEAGYLFGFSYSSHEGFYPRYCNRRIDVARRRREHGTTRETFLAILREADPPFQAQIIEGVFAYLPLEKFADNVRAEKRDVRQKLAAAVSRLRGQAVEVDDLSVKNDVIERALQDAAVLIREQGNTSGVDRVHTALHGYLRALCRHYKIDADDNAGAARLFKLLRTTVPALQQAAARKEDIGRIQSALATVIDALNPIRNNASMAHPNQSLLEVPEAALVIDSTRTLLNYLHRKLT